jgi:hypothetical protein
VIFVTKNQLLKSCCGVIRVTSRRGASAYIQSCKQAFHHVTLFLPVRRPPPNGRRIILGRGERRALAGWTEFDWIWRNFAPLQPRIFCATPH